MDEVKKEEHKSMKEFLTICIEERLMKYPTGVIMHECPKCRTKYQLNSQKNWATDSIVDLIMKMGERSEVFRLAIIEEMKERIINNNE